jgi:serine/threonine protein kinase
VYYSSSAIAVRWQSPEVLETAKNTPASDIFSLAVTFQELYAFGAIPFGKKYKTNMAVGRAIMDGERPERPEGCPDAMFKLISRMWAHEPKARPHARKVVSDLEKILGTNESTRQFYNFGTPDAEA